MAFQKAMPVKLFGELANKMINVMEKNNEDSVDLVDMFGRFALDSIGIAGFGFDLRAIEDKNSEWVTYYHSVMKGMAKPFFIIFSMFDTKYRHWFKQRQTLHENLTKLLNKMDDMIEEKRRIVIEKSGNGIDENKDLLTLMIESEMNGGEGLSDEELRSNLCIFFLAGHDTTATALATAVYELARNTEFQDRARKEILEIFGDGSDEILPTAEQLKELSYLNMFIKENLRKHPPAYCTTDRTCQEDLVLGNVHVPNGSQICFDMHSLQHNPNHWSRPFEFDPERFRAGGEADNLHSLCSAPFSTGSRHCVGMNFSLIEQRIALSLLLRKYTFSLPKDNLHPNGVDKRGIAWGLAIYRNPLKVQFNKRY